MLSHILIMVTAPCSAHALAQARPTMSYIPLVTVAHPNDNLQHPLSSLPKAHSRVPLQRAEDVIHCPLMHRNVLPLQVPELLCQSSQVRT